MGCIVSSPSPTRKTNLVALQELKSVQSAREHDLESATNGQNHTKTAILEEGKKIKHETIQAKATTEESDELEKKLNLPGFVTTAEKETKKENERTCETSNIKAATNEMGGPKPEENNGDGHASNSRQGLDSSEPLIGSAMASQTRWHALYTFAMQDPELLELIGRRVFQQADKDDSGSIDKMEIIDLVKLCSKEFKVPELAEEEIGHLFADLDLDSNSVVSLAEWLAFLKRIPSKKEQQRLEVLYSCKPPSKSGGRAFSQFASRAGLSLQEAYRLKYGELTPTVARMMQWAGQGTKIVGQDAPSKGTTLGPSPADTGYAQTPGLEGLALRAVNLFKKNPFHCKEIEKRVAEYIEDGTIPLGRLVGRLQQTNTIRVFLSSVFNGMELERKIFMQKHVPELEQICAEQGVGFVVADMRLGITQEMGDKGLTVLTCLQSIEQCDIFLGYYGQRYGWQGDSLQPSLDKAASCFPWVEEYRDKSVTELEFLAGALRDRKDGGSEGPQASLFLFRSNKYDAGEAKQVLQKIRQVDAKLAKALKECETGTDVRNLVKGWDLSKDLKGLTRKLVSWLPNTVEGAARLQELKKNVLARDSTYSLKDYPSPSVGAVAQLAFVRALVKAMLAKVKDSSLTVTDKEHNAFAFARSSVYGRDETIKLLLHYVEVGGETPVVVTGESGSGKSSVLAMVGLHPLNEETLGGKHCVLHFTGANAAGASSVSSLVSRVVKRSLDLLRRAVGTAPKAAPPDMHLDRQLAWAADQWHTSAGQQGKKLFLVLDGLNELAVEKTAAHAFEGSSSTHSLGWLPTTWPASVRVVVSATSECQQESGATLRILQKRSWKTIKCESSIETSKAIIKGVMASRFKVIDPKHETLLLQCEECQNSMFLSLCLQQILSYGTFLTIDKMLCEMLERRGLPELIDYLLGRVERDHGSHFVASFFRLVAVAQDGLSEDELSWLVNQPQLADPVLTKAGVALDGMEAAVGGRPPASSTQVTATELAALRFGLHRVLSESHGRLTVGDQVIKTAVYSRYFRLRRVGAQGDKLAEELEKAVHAQLAVYWQAQNEKLVLKSFTSEVPRCVRLMQFHQRKGGVRPSVQAAVRVRPFLAHESAMEENRAIFMKNQQTMLLSPASNLPSVFSFDFSLNSADSETPGAASQETVWRLIGKDAVQNVIEGGDSLIFAYGQTGSGKTYTMFGEETPDLAGLVPRACEHLISRLRKKAKNSGMRFRVKLSLLEIYCEQVHDLTRDAVCSCDACSIRKVKSSALTTPELTLGSDEAKNLKKKVLRVVDYDRDQAEAEDRYETAGLAAWEEGGEEACKAWLLAAERRQQAKDTPDAVDEAEFSTTSKEERGKEGERQGSKECSISQPTAAAPRRELVTCVAGLRRHTVNTKEQMASLIGQGMLKRITSGTAKNSTSSRSHCLLTLTVEQQVEGRSKPGEDGEDGEAPAGKESKSEGQGGMRVISHLHLIDLAGSERASTRMALRKEQAARIQREGASINQSLMSLNKCIRALADISQVSRRSNRRRAPRHVPFRDSLLTRLLRHSLTGATSVTTLVANVGPAKVDASESLSTLRYAQIAKLIQNRPKDQAEEKFLKEVMRLKRAVKHMSQWAPYFQGVQGGVESKVGGKGGGDYTSPECPKDCTIAEIKVTVCKRWKHSSDPNLVRIVVSKWRVKTTGELKDPPFDAARDSTPKRWHSDPSLLTEHTIKLEVGEQLKFIRATHMLKTYNINIQFVTTLTESEWIGGFDPKQLENHVSKTRGETWEEGVQRVILQADEGQEFAGFCGAAGAIVDRFGIFTRSV